MNGHSPHPTPLYPTPWHWPMLRFLKRVLPEEGGSGRQKSSLHAVSMKMLLNLLSNDATYFANGWDPIPIDIISLFMKLIDMQPFFF